MGQTRILVVDDHELFRKGLCALVESQPSLIVCGEAGDGLEAVLKARDLRPDVILMDIGLPTMGGLEATRRICVENPSSKIIVVSQHNLSHVVHGAFKCGAKAYIVKSEVSRRLWGTLQTVIQDGLFNWNDVSFPQEDSMAQ